MSPSSEYLVRIFASHLPTKGQLTKLKVEAQRVILPELGLSQPYSLFEVKMGGFHHDQLQLHWQHPYNGQLDDWMLVFEQSKDQAGFLKSLNSKQIKGLHSWRKDFLAQKSVWYTLLGAAGCLVFAVLFTVFQYSLVVSWVAKSISPETEANMGKRVLKSLSEGQTLTQSGPSYQTIKQLGDPLVKTSRYHYDWYVLNEDMPNAFSLPGGKIVVTTGLLKRLRSADELSGVLSHEVIHVEEQHALRKMIASGGIAAALAILGGDINSAILILAHQAGSAHQTRALEAEADEKGYQLLVDKKLNPAGLSEALKVLQRFQKEEMPQVSATENAQANKDRDFTAGDAKQVTTKNNKEKPLQKEDGQKEDSKSSEESTGWLDDHPALQVRIDALKELEKKHPCVTCTTTQWHYAELQKHVRLLETDKL